MSCLKLIHDIFSDLSLGRKNRREIYRRSNKCKFFQGFFENMSLNCQAEPIITDIKSICLRISLRLRFLRAMLR